MQYYDWSDHGQFVKNVCFFFFFFFFFFLRLVRDLENPINIYTTANFGFRAINIIQAIKNPYLLSLHIVLELRYYINGQLLSNDL